MKLNYKTDPINTFLLRQVTLLHYFYTLVAGFLNEEDVSVIVKYTNLIVIVY